MKSKKFRYNKILVLFFIIVVSVLLITGSVWGTECPGDLNDRADVVNNPSGNDYDVYFADDDTTSSDYFPLLRAQWVRDALLNSHNVYVSGTHNFRNPYFSVSPNDTCIFDSANIGTAPNERITLDAPSFITATEPYIRMVVAHELFHHVQFHYINFNQWPSWGAWTVEGTARSMEDKIFLDNDTTPANTLYVGQINNYLGNPNRTLMNISYTAALFWTYLCEQLGTPFPEPARGVDVIQRFWSNTDGHSPDSIKYLRETISSFSSGTTFEDMFRDFCITNYTHDLDVSGLSDPNRYQYFDESAAGGGTPYNPVARTTVPSWNTTYSSDVVRWGARYFEIDVQSEKQCEAIGFWGEVKEGKNLSWALISMRGGQVIDIYHSSGGSFYRTVINPNPPRGLYDKLAVVVSGLNSSADFDYAFGWGLVEGVGIFRPTLSQMAYVGEKDNPERFQVRLRLLGPSVLTPPGTGPISVRGLDSSDFDVKLVSVATGAEYDATIISAGYVSGEYWLVVQAPEITNAADGDLYDLEICFCEYDGICAADMTSANSVLYTKVTRNQMLVLDRSNSMNWDNKIDAAKNAARLYVNATSDDDLLGLVTFNGDISECNDDATKEWDLKTVSGNRSGLITTIDNVSASGWTSIGDGLKKGRNELLTATDPADVHSIALLSDGWENEQDYWASSNPDCSTPPVKDSFDPTIQGFASHIRIDTIAFGPDANQELMQNIAGMTGGDYYPVSSDPATTSSVSPPSLEIQNRLANVYRSIEEEVHGQDRLFYTAVRIPGGKLTEMTIPVTEKAGGGIRDAIFAFNWNTKTEVKISLYDPDGNIISGGDPYWKIFQGDTNKTYQYAKTLPVGDWKVDITPSSDVQVLCMLSGQVVRGVDIDLYFSQVPAHEECDPNPISTYLCGLPVRILANLNDSRGGIGGLGVEVQVYNPDGSSNRLTLFDDGNHGDSLSGDGIYGNAYTRTPFFSNGGGTMESPPFTGTFGSYTVFVTARGRSNYKEAFLRYITKGFQVYEYVGQECDPDWDNDGLPDRWEDLYGLDKIDPKDPGEDYDNDGLTNEEEFLQGTMPWNPDTDAGGESDGSEVDNGRDPLYEKDDLFPPLIDYGVVTQQTDIPVHLPQPNTNILYFPVNPAYQYIQIWRTDPGWVGFKMVDRIDLWADPSGVYYDRKVKNGVTYSYYLVAEGLKDALSAPTEIFTGTPKLDPLSPKGWVKINHNASRTDSLNVYLQLDTSDDSKWVMISYDPTFSGASWQPMVNELPFTLTPTGPGSSITTVYVKYMDLAMNESIMYSASIIVDRDGDYDGDGTINSVDLDDDNDGLSDKQEITATNELPFGYDPFNVDTDDNGISDGEEDPDRDLLTNLYELKHGTDPGHNLADINNDNEFNAFDIDLFRKYHEQSDPKADVNGDGTINAKDIDDFMNAYKNEQKYRAD